MRASELGEERLCPRCKDWWPLDNEFWPFNATTASGFHSWCKACWAEYQRDRRDRLRGGPPRTFRTPEERREHKRAYYLANREAVLARQNERRRAKRAARRTAA